MSRPACRDRASQARHLPQSQSQTDRFAIKRFGSMFLVWFQRFRCVPNNWTNASIFKQERHVCHSAHRVLNVLFCLRSYIEFRVTSHDYRPTLACRAAIKKLNYTVAIAPEIGNLPLYDELAEVGTWTSEDRKLIFSCNYFPNNPTYGHESSTLQTDTRSGGSRN